MPRRGESIYKRKDGRWEARYVKEIGADGKKKYGSVYAATYKEVKEKQQYFQNEPTTATGQKANRTVSELAWQWLFCNRNQVKASTYQKYEGLIRNHIDRSIGKMPVKLLNSALLEQYSNEQLMGGGVNGRALSRKTVNDILVILRMVFRFAEDEYHVHCPRIRLLREEKQERRVLSEQEQAKLTAYLLLDMDIYKFGVLLALYTGIRIGELCALKWEDISADTLRIHKTMQRLKGNGATQVFINDPKSACSKRVIPLPQFLKPYILEFRKRTGFVLQAGSKGYTEPRLLQYKFEKMIAVCGLPKTNFHALRHTFATRCVESSFDIKSLSEILGHSDVKTTLNRYVHSSFELKRSNMAKLSLPDMIAI